MAEAARLMRKFRIGCLVVVDKNHKSVGIVTERDIAFRLVAEGLDSNIKVDQMMTKDLKFVAKDSTLMEAAKIMASHAIKRLIVKEDGKMIGIITTTDILNVEKIGEDPSKYSFT